MVIRRRVLVDIVANTAGFRGGVQGAITKSTGLTSSLGTLGTAAAAGGVALAALTVGGVAASIAAFASFDAKLNESLAIMGDVSDMARGEMSDAAREVGRTTKFSATQAAESYFFLASAGLDAEASIAALPTVAAFAQAGMFDMATATDLATDAQSALGLASTDSAKNLANMTRVTDVLVKANTLANASVLQFSEALTNKAGAALRILNKDIEEGVAVLAVMADQGRKGAGAGEGLAIVLRDLQKAALEEAEEFERLNIAVFDNAGNMRNIADIIQDVEGATDGMSDATRKATLSNLGFQERSVQNIIALLGTSDAIRQYEEDLRSAGGITEEVADKQLDSLSGQFGLLKSEITDVAIGLGQELAPTFEEILPTLRDVIISIGAMIELIGPHLASVLEFTATKIRDFSGVVFAIAGIFDETADKQFKMIRALQGYEDLLFSGVRPIDAYASALRFLVERGIATSENIDRLNGITGLNAEQSEAAERAAAKWAIESGFLATEIIDLVSAVDQIDPSTGGAVRRFRTLERAADQLGITVEEAAMMFPNLADQLEDTGDAFDSSTDEVDEAAIGYQSLADRIGDALRAHESLADQIRAASDPIFRINNLMKRYSETLEDVDEDGKRTADEQLRLAEILIDLQSTINDVDPQNLQDGLAVIADALGISAESAADLLRELGLLDGQTFTTFFDFTQSNPYIPSPFPNNGVTIDGVNPHDIPIGTSLQGSQGPTVIINNPVTANAQEDVQGGLLLAGITSTVEGLL